MASASDSVTSADSGRGTARPACIEVANAVRIDCASAGCTSQYNGGIRTWVRGALSGFRPSHSIALIASWRRAVSESGLDGTTSEGSRYDGETGVRPVVA